MSFPLFVSIVGSCFTLAIIESSLFQKYSKLCVYNTQTLHTLL